jgi:hypothetical protein
MKAIPFFLMLLATGQLLNAQFQETFADGDFSNNPTWMGNTDHFIVTEGQLQLLNPEASGTNTSYLSAAAATSLEATTTWQFSFQLNFPPSAGNRLRIYLGADQPDLTAAEKAYFLEIGENGGDDAIGLYVKNQKNIELLAKGAAGAVANEPVEVRLAVSRTSDGQWTLLADYSGGDDLREEFSVSDTTFSVLSYFGFWCRYSATRSDAFLFDDISIDPLYVDRLPPLAQEVEAISAQEISVTFNEPLDSASAADPANYLIDGIGQPASVSLVDPSATTVVLELSSSLNSTQEYTLSINGVQDLNQNTLFDQAIRFIFYDIQPATTGDIIVSEILADPNPSQGLPEEEFFELYNRSEKVIQLSELMISSGASYQVLSDYLLLPGAYVAVCDDDELEAFSALGPAVAVRSLPSLSNSDVITITDLDTNLVSSLTYEQSWYDRDPIPEGGISLEIIDPDGPSDCPGNWAASRSATGGSPGTANSVAGLSPESIPPFVRQLEVVDAFEIRITFSEKMDENTVLVPSSYSFNPSLEILEVLPGADNAIIILLNSSLKRGQSYNLNLSTSIADCIGNPLGTAQTFILGLPEEAVPGDILLSELLFHPQTGGEDFVELFNVSDKVVNLKGWMFENRLKESGNTLQSFDNDFLIFPGEYVAVSAEPEDILRRYEVPAPGRLAQNDLPTLEAGQGNITLRRSDSLIIDAFDYDEGLHFSLLENKRGVSLERLSFDQPTQSSGNWHSAAESAGYATPTGPNSQQLSAQPGQELVGIDNPRFSPDNDGFEDVLLINVQPNRHGYVANIKIFDAQGRLVKELVRNSILGQSEVFKWDGRTNENSKARIGPYVVWVELFAPDGEVIMEKKTIVVAGKL